jgi:hypothetical protein
MVATLGVIGFVALVAAVFALDSMLTTRARICSPAKERFMVDQPDRDHAGRRSPLR